MMHLHFSQLLNPLGTGRRQPLKVALRKHLLQAYQDWLMKFEELSFIMDYITGL